MPIHFKDKARFITNLIEKADYTTAARECLILIEGGLRQVLRTVRDKLPGDNDILKEQENIAKGSKGKRVEEFTLGQSVAVISAQVKYQKSTLVIALDEIKFGPDAFVFEQHIAHFRHDRPSQNQWFS